MDIEAAKYKCSINEFNCINRFSAFLFVCVFRWTTCLCTAKAITTVEHYLKNARSFVRFIKDTPPTLCRLSQRQFTAVIREMDGCLKSLSRPRAVHQIKVKTQKGKDLVPTATLKECMAKAKAKIPELLRKYNHYTLINV